MNKIYTLVLALGLLLLPMPVFAFPVINSITFTPSSDIWTGESLTLRVNCTDSENLTITNVYVQIIGEDDYRIPDKNLTPQGGLYTTLIESLYLTAPNNFTVTVFCVNNVTNQSSQITYFTVSDFITDIAAISPSTIYVGDQIEIDVSVKKNDEPINSGVSFNIILNNQPKLPKISPPYDPNKGWVIYLDSPSASGTYQLQITAFYNRVNGTQSTSLSVSDPIQFSITSIDKTWVKPNDTINLQIQTFDRGSVIPINTNNLAVQVDSIQATVTAITPISNYFNVAILTPSLSSGSYTLTASFSYKNYTYTSNKTIDYIVSISGKVVDENEKGIAAQFRFFSNNVEKLRLYTDSNGAYSGNLPPGTYDVQAIFPQSTLYLYDVRISSFEDPIKYYYLTSDNIPGLNLAGLFVYEVAIPYFKASMEMKYDERNVLNENSIKVYRCEEWNTGRKECYDNWMEVDASVDRIRNIVYVNTTSLSAYAIGTLKQLSIDFNLNKQKFYLKDLVKLKGIVLDEYGKSVSNASVNVYVKNTNINVKTHSDSNGIFSIEFLSPEQEGNYTLSLSAEKNPYLSFNSDMNLEVVKSKEISIVFPDTIKIKQGENLTQDFTVVNIGQKDLSNLNISLTGIPIEYYTLIPEIEKLSTGEEKKLSIYFSVPFNASTGTSSATLKVFNDGVSKEKIFGFTISEKNQTVVAPAPPTGLVGKIVLPQISSNFIYSLLFAVIAFSLAFILKRKKIRNQGKDEIKNLLFDVKSYIGKKESELSTKSLTSAPQQTTPSVLIKAEKPPQENSEVAELNKLEIDLGDKNSTDN